jgi:hypothetical protein
MNFQTLKMDSQTSVGSNFTLNENMEFGQCTDFESLKRLDTFVYLNSLNKDNILIISNGNKFADKKSRFKKEMLDPENLYIDEVNNHYFLTGYGKMVKVQDYIHFLKENNKIFILSSSGKVNFKKVNDNTIINYDSCIMVSYTYNEYFLRDF